MNFKNLFERSPEQKPASKLESLSDAEISDLKIKLRESYEGIFRALNYEQAQGRQTDKLDSLSEELRLTRNEMKEVEEEIKKRNL